MRRYLLISVLLVFGSIMGSGSADGDFFSESGLVDIPTGAVLKHGIFGAGPSAAFRQKAAVSGLQTAPTTLGDAVAIRLNFGLFDRLELGLVHSWHEYEAERSTEQAVDVKVQLLKEREVGVRPSLAAGIEGLGSRILGPDSEDDEILLSVFGVVSKTFNLPRIHQFSGHIGIGTQRFAFAERSVGLFAGVSKEFQPAFARGDITMSLEFDGSGVNVGMRYTTLTGLQVALGAESLNDPEALRYLGSVSWTNARLLEQIDETRRLIQRATALAIEAKRAVTEKKDEK